MNFRTVYYFICSILFIGLMCGYFLLPKKNQNNHFIHLPSNTSFLAIVNQGEVLKKFYSKLKHNPNFFDEVLPIIPSDDQALPNLGINPMSSFAFFTFKAGKDSNLFVGFLFETIDSTAFRRYFTLANEEKIEFKNNLVYYQTSNCCLRFKGNSGTLIKSLKKDQNWDNRLLTSISTLFDDKQYVEIHSNDIEINYIQGANKTTGKINLEADNINFHFIIPAIEPTKIPSKLNQDHLLSANFYSPPSLLPLNKIFPRNQNYLKKYILGDVQIWSNEFLTKPILRLQNRAVINEESKMATIVSDTSLFLKEIPLPFTIKPPSFNLAFKIHSFSALKSEIASDTSLKIANNTMYYYLPGFVQVPVFISVKDSILYLCSKPTDALSLPTFDNLNLHFDIKKAIQSYPATGVIEKGFFWKLEGLYLNDFSFKTDSITDNKQFISGSFRCGKDQEHITQSLIRLFGEMMILF